MNNVIENRDCALVRTFDQHMDNIMEYYPRDVYKSLVEADEQNEPMEDENEKNTQRPKIVVSGRKYKGKKFVKSDKDSVFELGPEAIRGQLKIRLLTPFNSPTLISTRMSNTKEFYTELMPSVNQDYMNDPELQKVKPKEDAIKELMEMYDIEYTAPDKDDEAREKLQKVIDSLTNQSPL